MNRAKAFHDIQYPLCQCPRARSIYCFVDLELRQGSDTDLLRTSSSHFYFLENTNENELPVSDGPGIRFF